MKKSFLALATSLLLSLSMSVSAFACTGIIVGKHVSEDGSTLIGRTEDIGKAHPKLYLVSERQTYKPLDMFVDEKTGFTYPMPNVAYKYTYVPDSKVEEDGIYGAVGFNEYGVSISATVSASPNDKVLKADPFVKNGLREANIPSIVLPRVKTAKEGVKLIANIVEQKGSAEGNIVVLSDKDETWYIEILSGHRYVATKAPKNKVAVFPNCYMLGYLDLNDTSNVIASKDLIDFAKHNGFYKEYNNKFHIALSYGVPLTENNRQRLWGANHFLAPSKNIPYDAEVFDLFITPDENISLQDVMEFQKYRYEGTKLDANKNDSVRAIGTEAQAECHIIQVKDELPKDVGGVLWLTMGNAEHSVYLPTYGNITDTEEGYKIKADKYDPNSSFWIYRSLSALAELDRENYGKAVREYWTNYQEELIKNQNQTDKKLIELYKKSPQQASDFATKTGIDIATITKENAQKIYTDLYTHIISQGSSSTKKPFTISNN